MTNSPPDLKTIRAGKAKLLATASHHEQLAAKARAEAGEFDAAERVWLKLFGSDDANDMLAAGDEVAKMLSQMSTVERDAIGAGNLVEVKRKPPGVPPVPDMIIESLRLAEAAGKPGLTPQAMVAFVRTKYWPEAGNPDIGSTAWRMWKDGRLTKPHPESSVYGLANPLGGTIEAPEAEAREAS
jgi:hypothetical protein